MSLGAVSSSGGSGLLVVVYLLVVVLEVAAAWRVFTKAGQPGWAAIIPIYNYYVMLKVVGRPLWWLILFFIPLVNVVIAIVVLHDLSKSFGHGGGFTAGLLFLSFIFLPILGFGSDRYLGPAGRGPVFAGGAGIGAGGAYDQGSWGGPSFGGGQGGGQGYGYDPGFIPGASGSQGPVNPTPASAPTSPANWYPDPTGRHELRYFDGATWTEHVSDYGAQATDPV